MITATATNEAGSTSEFSAWIPVKPVLAIDNVATLEGDSGLTEFVFTVNLSAASTQLITVDFATVPGTATAGIDCLATSGTLTFNPGELTRTITMQVIGDTVFEADETFLVVLSNPANATLAGPGVGTRTILNDDAQPSISIDSVTLPEGDSGTTPFIFTVTLSNASAFPITVDFATVAGTAGEDDYEATSGTLSFAPGETQKTITVFVYGDTMDEFDETFFIVLSGPTNAIIAGDSGTGTGTIVNDDDPPVVSITGFTGFEGDTG